MPVDDGEVLVADIAEEVAGFFHTEPVHVLNEPVACGVIVRGIGWRPACEGALDVCFFARGDDVCGFVVVEAVGVFAQALRDLFLVFGEEAEGSEFALDGECGAGFGVCGEQAEAEFAENIGRGPRANGCEFVEALFYGLADVRLTERGELVDECLHQEVRTDAGIDKGSEGGSEKFTRAKWMFDKQNRIF